MVVAQGGYPPSLAPDERAHTARNLVPILPKTAVHQGWGAPGPWHMAPCLPFSGAQAATVHGPVVGVCSWLDLPAYTLVNPPPAAGFPPTWQDASWPYTSPADAAAPTPYEHAHSPRSAHTLSSPPTWSAFLSTVADEDAPAPACGFLPPLLSPTPSQLSTGALFMLDDPYASTSASPASAPAPSESSGAGSGPQPLHGTADRAGSNRHPLLPWPASPAPSLLAFSPAPSENGESDDDDAVFPPEVPCEVPLGMVGAPRRMLRMMGVYRLDPFADRGARRGSGLCWDGKPPGPLRGEPIVVEFQVYVLNICARSGC
jgi:hypothetical protein